MTGKYTISWIYNFPCDFFFFTHFCDETVLMLVYQQTEDDAVESNSLMGLVSNNQGLCCGIYCRLASPSDINAVTV